PPLRLVLAPVVLQELGEEPPRVAFLRAFEQLAAQALDRGELLAALLGRLAALRRLPPREAGRTEPDEPFVEPRSRDAVLRVVALDLAEDRVVPGLQPLLEEHRGLPAAAYLGRALEAVQLLDRLQRIALLRDPQGLAD